jgi:hypothetical protein
MVHEYKICNIVGPQGIFSGYVLLFLGIITSIFTWTGIVIAMLGAGMAFSYHGISFDNVNMAIFPYIKWFGVVKKGKWVKIDNTFQIGLESYRGRYTLAGAYRRGTDTKRITYQIVIENRGASEKIILARFKDLSVAKNEVERLKKDLFSDLDKV